MKKEIKVSLNEKEVEIIKEALETQKVISRIKANGGGKQVKEEAINELYNIESIEKKVGK
jgi:hypothetical protein